MCSDSIRLLHGQLTPQAFLPANAGLLLLYTYFSGSQYNHVHFVRSNDKEYSDRVWKKNHSQHLCMPDLANYSTSFSAFSLCSVHRPVALRLSPSSLCNYIQTYIYIESLATVHKIFHKRPAKQSRKLQLNYRLKDVVLIVRHTMRWNC